MKNQVTTLRLPPSKGGGNGAIHQRWMRHCIFSPSCTNGRLADPSVGARRMPRDATLGDDAPAKEKGFLAFRIISDLWSHAATSARERERGREPPPPWSSAARSSSSRGAASRPPPPDPSASRCAPAPPQRVGGGGPPPRPPSSSGVDHGPAERPARIGGPRRRGPRPTVPAPLRPAPLRPPHPPRSSPAGEAKTSSCSLRWSSYQLKEATTPSAGVVVSTPPHTDLEAPPGGPPADAPQKTTP